VVICSGGNVEMVKELGVDEACILESIEYSQIVRS